MIFDPKSETAVQLKAAYGRRFKITKNKITFITDPIVFTHRRKKLDIGKAKIVIELKGDYDYFDLFFLQEDERSLRHPHVYSCGSPCFGSRKNWDTLRRLIKANAYDAAIDFMWAFLNTYNGRDSASSLDSIKRRIYCKTCGDHVDDCVCSV